MNDGFRPEAATQITLKTLSNAIQYSGIWEREPQTFESKFEVF